MADVCPYCGGTVHVFEDGIDSGYDDSNRFVDEYWCSCKGCGKFFVKIRKFTLSETETIKEEDYNGE